MSLCVILVAIKRRVYVPTHRKTCPAQGAYVEVIMKVVLDLEITEIPGTNTWRAFHLLTLAIRLISNTSTTELNRCIIAHNDRGDIQKGEIRAGVGDLRYYIVYAETKPAISIEHSRLH
jgi:hypothetical protein